MNFKSFIQQFNGHANILEHPLQLGRLHHDSSSAGTCSGLLQQSPGSLVLSVLTLQFNSCQPDVLAVGVGLESQGQNGPGSRNVSLREQR